MIERLFDKYLLKEDFKKKGNTNKQDVPKTPKDAQKAVEALAAQLAVQILSLHDEYNNKGGKLKKFIDQAEEKTAAAISKLHPDARVVSHFLSTYQKLVGNTLSNEIPNRVSNIIKVRANVGIGVNPKDSYNSTVQKLDATIKSLDPIDKSIELAIDTGEEDIDTLIDTAYMSDITNQQNGMKSVELASENKLIDRYLGEDSVKKRNFPARPDRRTINWWDTHSEEEQRKWIAEYPNSVIAHFVGKGMLKVGVKVEGEGKPGNKPVEELDPKSKATYAEKVRKIKLDKEKKETSSNVVAPEKPFNTGPTKEQKKEEEKKEEEKLKKAKEKENENHPGQNLVGKDPKNKELKLSAKPVDSTVWKSNSSISNKEWERINKVNVREKVDSKIPNHFRLNKKIPQRYFDVMERMLGSKNNKITSKISHFVPGASGAGTIESQAGELLMMMSSCMEKNEWKEFKSFIKNRTEKKGGIVTNDWVDAAEQCRDSMFNRLSTEYPGIDLPNAIEAGAWDTKEEVEGLGMDDYDKNKGFSTDVYFRIKYKGKPILVEQSLKKDLDVFFLNSGAGKLQEMDANLPKELDSRIFLTERDKRFTSFMSDNKDLINKIVKDMRNIDPENDLVKDFENLDSYSGKLNSDKRHAIVNMMQYLSKSGNEVGIKAFKEIEDQHNDFVKNCAHGIIHNEKLRNGVLNMIRKEFPLKAVAEGEEGISLGPYSLDRKTFKEIFGSSNWNDIKEKLDLVVDKKTNLPYLAYNADNKGTVIPITEIKMRQRGKHYESWSFEMNIHKDFKKQIISSNGVYSINSSYIFTIDFPMLMEKYLEKQHRLI